MEMNLNGRKVKFQVARSNLKEQIAKHLGISESEIPDGMVQYDPETNTVLVDKNTSGTYARYAALHECICAGPYKALAPKTTNPSKRCGLIDRMIIKIMPKSERKDYVSQRIKLFEAMIEYNLNPAKDKQFREALASLKSISE